MAKQLELMNMPADRKAEIQAMKRDLVTLKNTFAELLPDGYLAQNIYSTEQLSNMDTLYMNNRYAPLTINRMLLSFLYSEHGIVQSLVDQPVQDALRGGVDITSSELDADDIKALQEDMENAGSLARLEEANIWKRLYGGAGLIINVWRDPVQPFDNGPTKDLEFLAVDRWELTNPRGSEFYLFYGKKIHRSRVIELVGKEASSLIRPQLQGWGQSEVEKIVRDLNAYFKNKNVIFEILDEAKIDVYAIKGFNTLMGTATGTARVQRRMEIVNSLKNYRNAVVLDSNDKYDQKTMTFSGLSDMMKEDRISLACALRMPMTKLFGISSAGFNSGEDDIENYNAMIESEIRSKMRNPLRMIIGLHCLKVFGYIPQFEFSFKPLRMMSEKDEEDIKRSRQDRIIALYDRGLLDPEETGNALSQMKLLPIETRMEAGDLPEAPVPPAQAAMAGQMGQGALPGGGQDGKDEAQAGSGGSKGQGDAPEAKDAKEAPTKPKKNVLNAIARQLAEMARNMGRTE